MSRKSQLHVLNIAVVNMTTKLGRLKVWEAIWRVKVTKDVLISYLNIITLYSIRKLFKIVIKFRCITVFTLFVIK